MSTTPASSTADAVLKDRISHIQTLREAARQLTGLTAALPTLYFAVISFSDIRQAVRGWPALLFLLPALPWLVSQILITGMFLPRALDPQSTLAQQAAQMDSWIKEYQRRLYLGYWGLVVGLALLVLVLGIYLTVIPLPPAQP